MILFIAISAAAEPIAWLGVGLKAAAGGNYLSVPDDKIEDSCAFYDGAGGVAGAAVLRSKRRFLKRISGSRSIFCRFNRTWCAIDYNIPTHLTYLAIYDPAHSRFVASRFVTRTTRVSIGIGPEFISPRCFSDVEWKTENICDRCRTRYRESLYRA